LLRLVDVEIGRELAPRTADAMATIMRGVSYEKAKVALPRTCISLMPLVGEDELRDCAKNIKAIDRVEMDDVAKALNLGVVVAQYYGLDVVRQAIATLGSSVRESED
jgi:uncharacterized protein with ACT and thioredoxin-like domain